MRKILFSLLFISSTVLYAQVKCPSGQVDCPGICGLFTDNNNDGFCDYGELSEKNTPKQDSTKTENQPVLKNKPATADTSSSKVKISGREAENTVDSSAQAIATEPIVPGPQETTNKKVPYLLIPISIGLLVLYFISLTLIQLKKIKKVTHRKIWNIGLTIAFLFSGISGLLLVFFINYAYIPSCYRLIVKIHVDFGIAMAIISIFHIFWHLRYFKNLFKKSK